MTEPTMQPANTQPEPRVLESDPAECAAFQASMAERIGDGEDLQANPHMATCERCTALVRELEAIAEAARQLMPIDAEPDDDLWSKIESRLGLEESESLERESTSQAKEESAIALEGGLAFEGGIA
jgi:hypothetical protein